MMTFFCRWGAGGFRPGEEPWVRLRKNVGGGGVDTFETWVHTEHQVTKVNKEDGDFYNKDFPKIN